MQTIRLLVILCCLTLTACYESQSMLLDSSASRQPISTYQDWHYSSGSTRYRARLNPRSDGWYDYSEARIQKDGSEATWKHHTVLLNYLENAKGMDVYVFGVQRRNVVMYGLVAFLSNGRWQSFSPNCDIMSDDYESDLQAAKQAGASIVSTKDSDTCVFANRSSLFAAMHSVVAHSRFVERVRKATD